MATLCLLILFTLVALAVGFFSGAWFFGDLNRAPAHEAKQAVVPQEPESDSNAEMVRVAEQAMMAFQRVQDVASSLADDADAHTAKVDAITRELKSIAAGQSDISSDAVLTAISEITEINLRMKERLGMAEKQLESQASELHNYENEARTDSLTGLANRRAFDDELQRQYQLWRRQNTPFTLMILDIDRFKGFNDSHGHQAGDEVLRSVGKLLTKTARQMDLPCRYGGEEFAVLLPATEIREARLAAERFRTTIEGATVNFNGQRLTVTTSVGVAEIADSDDTARLIRRADDALYQSKEAGRNCGYWHDGQRCLPVLADSVPYHREHPKKTIQDTIKSFELLPSKTLFVETLQRRIAESQRFGMHLSVIQMQIEDYSRIKNEYGKAFARELIDAITQRAQLTLREMDFLARYDDGEFVVMLARCSEREATKVAERLQAIATQSYNPTGKVPLRLSARVGIAELGPKENAEGMMARAFAALSADAEQDLLVGSYN